MRHYLDALSDTIRENWDRPALTDYSVLGGGHGNDYSYGNLYQKIVWLGKRFCMLGLERGDHIGICGVNSANWAVSYLAIAAFQGVSVTILNSQMPAEIAKQISFADCKALFVDDEIWNQLPKDLPVAFVFSLDDYSILRGKHVIENDQDNKIDEVRFASGNINDLAQICFTSGSEDEPKAVMLSYSSICNNVWVGIEICPIQKWENVVSILPSAHVFGLIFEILDHMINANHVFFMGRNNSFSSLSEAFSRVHTCLVRTVPLVLEQLYYRVGDKIKDILGDNIQQIFVGGSAINVDVEDALVRLGLPISVGYGSTETGPLISATNYKYYIPHSVGKVVSGMEARVSEAGEILVKGANVMLGYYKNPEATRRKIDADGWLHTGDRGRVEEDGTVYVYGRLEQDMIVLPSGENIVPQNIEALLDGIDGVAESLVLERGGRLVALVYPETVADAGTLPDKDSLLRSVNVQLPSFSQLSDIEFVSSPFQRTGKSGIKRYLYS